MNTTELILKIISIIGIAILALIFFERMKRIEENTERAAEALEYIAGRIDEESANNVLDKIEKDLNSR